MRRLMRRGSAPYAQFVCVSYCCQRLAGAKPERSNSIRCLFQRACHFCKKLTMVPAKYNIRKLRVRWVTTLMTVVGTGLVVSASVLTCGLTVRLDYALRTFGQPFYLLVLRKGSND